jgi:hypothetical protein
LQKYSKAFAWEYNDMKSIHLDTFNHHIYIKENVKSVQKLQKRINSILKNIVKEELQKIVDVEFIFPLSYNEWVSPLVIVPKKVINGRYV